MRNTFFFIVSLFLFQPAWSLDVRILDVHDGDTLTAIGVSDSAKYKIRLMGVDTPEVDFFNHSQGDIALRARDALKNLLPKGALVSLGDDSDVDKHGRILGRIFKDSVDINKEMLREGYGLIYFIAPFNKALLHEYSAACEEAYLMRKGLFSSPFEEPYVFRMRVRQQTGRNLVGNIESKNLYPPEKMNEVPVWLRLFFSDEVSAKAAGYHY